MTRGTANLGGSHDRREPSDDSREGTEDASRRGCANRGAILGIGRTAAYELIRPGTWPTPILRLGKLIRVPSPPLLDLVGVSR